jgi:hypothetical protein
MNSKIFSYLYWSSKPVEFPEHILDFLKERWKISEEMLDRSGIFYVKNPTLSEKILRENFSEKDLLDSGLFDNKGKFTFHVHRLLVPYYVEDEIEYIRGFFIPEKNKSITNFSARGLHNKTNSFIYDPLHENTGYYEGIGFPEYNEEEAEFTEHEEYEDESSEVYDHYLEKIAEDDQYLQRMLEWDSKFEEGELFEVDYGRDDFFEDENKMDYPMTPEDLGVYEEPDLIITQNEIETLSLLSHKKISVSIPSFLDVDKERLKKFIGKSEGFNVIVSFFNKKTEEFAYMIKGAFALCEIKVEIDFFLRNSMRNK